MGEKEQTTIRLTLRIPEGLDRLIREVAVRRGTNINQTMIHILTKYFKDQRG